MKRFPLAAALVSAPISLAFPALLLLPSQPLVAQPSAINWARFLDKNGGYTDKVGGYYNPKAGTYTDKEGGIVDNWQGYTYKDGSYKGATGDYWDAPSKTFKLANGEELNSAETTNDEAVRTLRDTAEENGKYNKDGIRSAMMARIKLEHPAAPAK